MSSGGNVSHINFFLHFYSTNIIISIISRNNNVNMGQACDTRHTRIY